MAVGADLGGARQRREIQPVRQRRQRITGVRRRIVSVERRRKRGERGSGDVIDPLLFAPDPLLPAIEFSVHRFARTQCNAGPTRLLRHGDT